MSSATTSPRSVTSTASPDRTSRTYSLNRFFKSRRPTLFIFTMYLHEATFVNREVSDNGCRHFRHANCADVNGKSRVAGFHNELLFKSGRFDSSRCAPSVARDFRWVSRVGGERWNGKTHPDAFGNSIDIGSAS